METQVNTAIKRDGRQPNQYVPVTENGVQWVNRNRRPTLIFVGLALLLIIALSVAYSLFQHRTADAQTAFGQAMQIYQTPLVRPDQPLPPGMKAYNTAKERASLANVQFVQVAKQYGLTEPGKLAQYFAGVTYLEAGQTGQAEDALKQVAKGWNGDTAALGKAALAQLYQQTGQNDQAIALYQSLIKGHASTVPPGLAQLQLAALYTTMGRTEDARHVYAELKDRDKDAKGKPGVAAQVATERLNPQPAQALGAR